MPIADTKITLLDFPTSLPNGYPLSPYTARVRYVLNYKQLAFKTEWIEYTDIESILKQRGFKPTGTRPDGSPRYTVPALLDETQSPPTLITDSRPIIQYLDSTYPTPDRPIFPSSIPGNPSPAIHLLAASYYTNCVHPSLRWLLVPDIYRTHKETVRDSWLSISTDSKAKSIEDVPGSKTDSEEYKVMWEKMKRAFEGLAGMFEKNSEGVWIMGDKPTFADFVILSYLMVAKLSSPDTVWKEVKGLAGGRWERYIQAGEPYMAIN